MANSEHVNDGAKVLKIPEFSKKNVATFFHQLEPRFAVANVTCETAKYNYVLASLEADVIELIADCITDPLPADPYQMLKKRLIKEFTESDYKKIEKLLNDIVLGSRKPSQMLREMQELAGNCVTGEFLKSLFLQRLPKNVRGIVVSAKGDTLDLDKLAKTADMVVDVWGSHDADVTATPAPTKRRAPEQAAGTSGSVETPTKKVHFATVRTVHHESGLVDLENVSSKDYRALIVNALAGFQGEMKLLGTKFGEVKDAMTKLEETVKNNRHAAKCPFNPMTYGLLPRYTRNDGGMPGIHPPPPAWNSNSTTNQ